MLSIQQRHVPTYTVLLKKVTRLSFRGNNNRLPLWKDSYNKKIDKKFTLFVAVLLAK
jgi:hypothetical protein